MTEDKMKQLDEWINELIYPGAVDDFVQTFKRFDVEDEHVKEICIYTEQHKYKIYANDRKKDDGYLGCQVTARMMRAGEDWFRGNDLADGPFTYETWLRILNTIVNYELVILSKFTKPSDTPEDVV